MRIKFIADNFFVFVKRGQKTLLNLSFFYIKLNVQKVPIV